ncbi:nuclease-related domain-containing protein [Roseospira navarrensis]|uniref:NERD domain-containing protein n=1 Tax=Roseospira navarrensis TaxID=140058 RepID=A0A7X1ZGN8_9PROT|nr:nuclease-related domain-containing protein [Roseospira navarrensis]MQX38218.1 hypothetical protein [Roseospira navarrensis]
MDQNLAGPLTDLLWILLLWVVALFLLTGGTYMTLGPALRQGPANRRAARALARAGLPALHDLVLRTAWGGLIRVDHVVRLPTGFVVLQIVMRAGRLVGTRRQRVWRQDVGLDSHTFGNPLRRLDKAMAAVRRALPPPPEGADAPVVTGQVLVPRRARFARGRPEGVSNLGAFLEELHAAHGAAADGPEAPGLEEAWQALSRAALAVPDGDGPLSWLRRPRRLLRSALAETRTAMGLLFLGTGAALVVLLW